MNKDLKIVLVSSKSITINTFFQEFIKICQNKNYNLKIMTSDIENLKISNLDKIKIYLPKNFFEILNIFKLFYYFYKNYKIIYKNNDKIFLLNTPLASHFFRIISFFIRIKVIYYVHGFRFHPKGNNILNLLFKIIERLLALKTDLYVVINKHDENFVKKLNKKYIKVNGVGYNSTIYGSYNIKKINHKNITIGVVSAYRKNKGYDDIIKVAETLRNSNNLKIVCFGYDNFKKYNEKVIKLKLKNIIFNNFTYEIKNEIDKFDIFLHLSKREGLSVSLIQSMRSGVPCIASNIRGINDIITHNSNGFLVEPSDTNTIKKIILNLIKNNDLYQNISYNSYKTIDHSFKSKYIFESILDKLSLMK